MTNVGLFTYFNDRVAVGCNLQCNSIFWLHTGCWLRTTSPSTSRLTSLFVPLILKSNYVKFTPRNTKLSDYKHLFVTSLHAVYVMSRTTVDSYHFISVFCTYIHTDTPTPYRTASRCNLSHLICVGCVFRCWQAFYANTKRKYILHKI